MFDFLRSLTKSAEEKRQEAVSAYLDGALTPVERRRFEQELAQDPGLRAELEEQRLLQQTLRRLPRRNVPRNFTLDPALYGRPQPQPLFRLYPVLQAATALTAVFFVLAIVLDLLMPMGGFSAGQMAEPAAEAVSQAEEAIESVAEEVVGEEPAEEPVEEEAAAEPVEEAMEEAAEEEPAPEADVLTLEAAEETAAEDATVAALEGTVAAPALAATTTEIRPSPQPTPTRSDAVRLPTAPAVPERVITESVPAEQADGEPAVAADETPAEVTRDAGTGVTAPAPLSDFRKLEIGLAAAFVFLLLITYLVRRQL
ncbi:MAG TPA: zf-HC2 domain-containing protein [Anaerolineae bacterium]